MQRAQSRATSCVKHVAARVAIMGFFSPTDGNTNTDAVFSVTRAPKRYRGKGVLLESAVCGGIINNRKVVLIAPAQGAVEAFFGDGLTRMLY